MPSPNTIDYTPKGYVRSGPPSPPNPTVSDGTKAYAGSAVPAGTFGSVGALPGVKQPYDTSNKTLSPRSVTASQIAASIGRHQDPAPVASMSRPNPARPTPTAPSAAVGGGAVGPAMSGSVYQGLPGYTPISNKPPGNMPGVTAQYSPALGGPQNSFPPGYTSPIAQAFAGQQPRTPSSNPGYAPVPGLATDMNSVPRTEGNVPFIPDQTYGSLPAGGSSPFAAEVARAQAAAAPPAGGPPVPARNPTFPADYPSPRALAESMGNRMGYRSSGTQGYAPGHGQMTAPLMSRG